MNSCCTLYDVPLDTTQEKVDLTVDNCDCKCACGYIQYEQLAVDFDKISNIHTQDADHIITEARLRQRIVEVSRYFDELTSSDIGEHSKAHTKVITVYANGTRYMQVPLHVPGTLEVYKDGYLINPSSYGYDKGYLIFQPCQTHTATCGCSRNCGEYQSSRPAQGWQGCYQIRAKFGNECADYAVQLAVKLYIIYLEATSNPAQTIADGFIKVRVPVPDVWTQLVLRYTSKKKKFNRFAIA